MILSEGEALGGEGELPGVYKYQSADAIIREVMACYCTRTAEPASSQVGSKSILIGVYSPINRCLKTSFSLVLGQVLAKDQQVLYLSLEDCSGLSKIMGQSGPGDFSDVLYYYSRGGLSWARLNPWFTAGIAWTILCLSVIPRTYARLRQGRWRICW